MGEPARLPGSDGEGPANQHRDALTPVAADAAEHLRRSQELLAETERLAQMGSWVWVVGADHIDWSAGLCRLIGLEPEDRPVEVSFFLDAIHPDDREHMTHLLNRTVRHHEHYDTEVRMTRRDGTVRWLQARGEVVETDGDRAVRLGGYVQDTTDLHEAQAELARQQELLRRIARGDQLTVTLEAICVDIERRFPDCHCSILLVDPTQRELHHGAAPTLPREVIRAVEGLPMAVGMGACGTATARREVVVVEDAATDPLVAPFRELLAGCGLVSIWSLPLLDPAGEVLGTFALYRPHAHRPDEAERDVVAAAGSIAALAIERSHNEAALTAAAQVDPLTGLPNRNHFLERLDDQLSRDGADPLAVMFLDLDRFKWINDSLGHPTGDRILVEVAHRLRRVLRGEDVVARFGGDEFTILLHDARGQAIERVANRVKAAFADPVLLDGGEFFLSVSVGVAVADASSDAAQLVRDADAAMYAAKERGRDRWALFDQGLRRRAIARVTVEAELRRAIERDEVVLHYQPIRDLATGRWRGVEALARWQHPVRGLLGPDEFIPLAEETGLIAPLGLKLVDQAVAQAALWLRAGHKTCVSVNLSVVQLDDPDLPGELQASLRRMAVPPALMTVEITETGVMQRLDSAKAVLERIAAQGVEVYIDDFGTGYSSIARLSELPVVGVKVDRRFTLGLGEDPSVAAVLGPIIDLAHALDLQVVAEGIETEAALSAVARLGADQCQGYHLARPTSAAGVEGLLD